MISKRTMVASVAAVLMAVVTSEGRLGLGGKVWIAQVEDAEDISVLVGPIASLDLGNHWWLSGVYLAGEAEFEGRRESDTEDVADAEVVLGHSFEAFDLGVGWRGTKAHGAGYFGESAKGSPVSDADVAGPMVYLGLGQLFEKSKWGWYAGTSWLFWDDLEGGEHVNVEAGLSYLTEHVTFAVGPRIKEFVGDEEGASVRGVTASVEWRF